MDRLLAAVTAKFLILKLSLDEFLVFARPVVGVFAHATVELQ